MRHLPFNNLSALTGIRNRAARTDGFARIKSLLGIVAILVVAFIAVAVISSSGSSTSSTAKRGSSSTNPNTTKAEDAPPLLVATYRTWAARIGNFADRAEAINYLVAAKPNISFVAINSLDEATTDAVGIVDAKGASLSAAVKASSDCAITLTVANDEPTYSDCQPFVMQADAPETGATGEPGVTGTGTGEGTLLISGWAEPVTGTTLYTADDAGNLDEQIGDVPEVDFTQEFFQGGKLYGTDSTKDIYAVSLTDGSAALATPAEAICKGSGKGIYSSPDTTTAANVEGGRVALLCGNGKTIETMNLDGSDPQVLVSVRADEQVVEVAAEGSTVLFSVTSWKGRKSLTNIWQVSVTGGAPTRLSALDAPEPGDNAWFNVGGGQIAVTRNDGIYTMPITGGPLNQVVSEGGVSLPRLNSDGTKLAYLDGDEVVHILDLSSRANVALGNGGVGHITGLNWLPAS